MGFSNLFKTDSVNLARIIKKMEGEKFLFASDKPSTFTHRGIYINIINGEYCIKRRFNVCDIPTIKIREDTSKDIYVPSLEELKHLSE